MRKPRILAFLCFIVPIFLWQCQTQERVDMILHNGVVYSVVSIFSTQQAFAIKGGMFVAIGSDFPVKGVNPLFGFHSAVARTDDKNLPEGGFQMENSLSRQEALRGMTIWAAKANFEEKTRGSIEPGKFADFVILQKDIMRIPLTEVRAVKVIRTVVGGKTLFY